MKGGLLWAELKRIACVAEGNGGVGSGDPGSELRSHGGYRTPSHEKEFANIEGGCGGAAAAGGKCPDPPCNLSRMKATQGIRASPSPQQQVGSG